VGTQSTEWVAAARLVRRTGFGATGPAVDAVVRAGTTAYLSALLSADPNADSGAAATPAPTFGAIAALPTGATTGQRQARNQQIADQLSQLATWWIRRMVHVQQPFGEKLTFCWHNHFATAASKVRVANRLLGQNQTLRRMGRGDFRSLALAMLTDAATLDWLDGEKNTAQAPNENLAREFMELFALGHGDGYTETDVREAARALTGWKIRADNSTYVNARQHDNGSKTVLGVTGNLDDVGFCDAVLARPSAPTYLATRWWGQLVSDTAPSASTLAELTSAYGAHRNLAALFTAMFATPAFAAAEGSLVADPVEWLIGAVRALKAPVVDDPAAKKLLGVLRALGQVPFDPPNVSGWPSGQAWLSTAAADTRIRAATTLTRTADLSSVTETTSSDRLDAVAYLLGVGGWSDRSAAVLKQNVSNPPVLVAVALNTPEYLVH
jgi:uncharacterized protein (DUF1800 family)